MTDTTLTGGSVLGELSRRRKFVNTGMSVLVYIAFALALIPLVWLSYTVVSRGIDRFMVNSAGQHVFNLEFLQQSMRGIFGGEPEWRHPARHLGHAHHHGHGGDHLDPDRPPHLHLSCRVRQGPAQAGGDLLRRRHDGHSFDRRRSLRLRALLDSSSGRVPRTAVTGAVALSVLMIPVVVRSSEEMLRLVPNELREASYALGVPKYLTVLKVVVPTAFAGITTGVTLAVARVIGETAPLLIAVGVADSLNFNPFNGRMMTLPVYIVNEWHKGAAVCGNAADPTCLPQITEYRAWGAALVLILIVMALNLVARLVSKYFSPKTGR